MSSSIPAPLKPLYANLLRLNIGEYIISRDFDHLMIELNLDEAWGKCLSYVKSQSSVVILIPGYTGDAEDALGIFLNSLFSSSREQFIKTIKRMLLDFQRWSQKTIDFTELEKNITDLGYEVGIVSEVKEMRKKEVRDITVDEPRFKQKGIKVDPKLCFVLMPFKDKFFPIYDKIIKIKVEEAGLTCLRADEIFGSRPIMNDIWSQIQKANILIADLTERNPNVFYELGLAHATGKEVILISQSLQDVPFDLRHYRVIVYEDSISGSEKLRDGLETTLKSILK